MATKYFRTIGSWWILLLVTTSDPITQGGVEGLRTFDKSNFGPKPKGTIKTIEVLEDGDMIDCIDIYKQPAFHDPHIKDLKMEPRSKLSLLNKTKDFQPKVIQNWHKYGECPERTIPIRRTWNNNTTILRKTPNDDPNIREYASAYQLAGTYHGAGAFFNVWNPSVTYKSEFSLTQFWVVSGSHSSPMNTIESGWIVYPDLYHDSQTRFFIYWTRDYYATTGCYDLTCPGFVQTNHRFALGARLSPVSVYNEDPYNIYISVVRDVEEGDWWLKVQDTMLGYFPKEIFTTLGDGANQVEFGGEIGNHKDGGNHTRTGMGSGHPSHEGFRKASLVHNIKVVNENYDTVDADLNLHVTRPECYDLNFGPSKTDNGSHFFYGGIGFSHECH